MDTDNAPILTCLDRVAHQVLDSARNHSRSRQTDNPPVGLAWDIQYSENVKSWSYTEVQHGFVGRVWFRLKKRNHRHFASDWFSDSRTSTGTGGFGGYDGPWEKISRLWWVRNSLNRSNPNLASVDYEEPCCFSWDYRIILKDWPGLMEIVANERNTRKIYSRLKGTRDSFAVSHKFRWEDPDQVEKDRVFEDESTKLINSGILIIPKK